MSSGVNFINILSTNFLYERHFGSFFYVHVTREKLPKLRFLQKFCAQNVDEIDTCYADENERVFFPSILKWIGL